MDFDQIIKILNQVLSEKQPERFNSSWILRHVPICYRFIRKHTRTELNKIDWDKVTYAIEWKFQRRWAPDKLRKNTKKYENNSEVEIILNKYRHKLYVFLSPAGMDDRRVRDVISISLVRLAQSGNILAKKEIMKLATYTINDWVEKYYFLNRWQGYNEEIQDKLEGCIRRYRYTGSFMNYVFRTLEYAGRGIRPFYGFSLNEPVALGVGKCKIDNIIQDPDTGQARIFDKTTWEY